MTTTSSKDGRIPEFKESMAKIGLDWNNQYRLVDTGQVWQIEWIRPVTEKQCSEGLAILESVLNS